MPKLGAAFPPNLMLAGICERCVYLEVNSRNKNNIDQVKNKYKLCLSNEVIDKVIGGKIFCASCSHHEYFQQGKDHVYVTKEDYEECLSDSLKNNDSVYIPKYVEFLANEELLDKKRDGFSFKYRAKIKAIKFLEVRKAVKRKIYNIPHPESNSIMELRRVIGLSLEISVLEKYGVKVDKTIFDDW